MKAPRIGHKKSLDWPIPKFRNPKLGHIPYFGTSWSIEDLRFIIDSFLGASFMGLKWKNLLKLKNYKEYINNHEVLRFFIFYSVSISVWSLDCTITSVWAGLRRCALNHASSHQKPSKIHQNRFLRDLKPGFKTAMTPICPSISALVLHFKTLKINSLLSALTFFKNHVSCMQDFGFSIGQVELELFRVIRILILSKSFLFT